MIVTITLAALLLDPAARPSPAPTPAPMAETAKAQPTRYCVAGTTTGSRMERKTCLTREEWLGRGFDPLNPQD